MESEAKERKPRRARRSFSVEFKAEAVLRVREEGRTTAEVARKLVLTPSALVQWVRQSEVDAGKGPVGVLSTSEREDLNRLRREHRQVKMERDILKNWSSAWRRSVDQKLLST